MTTPDKSTRPLWARLAYTAGLGGATECSVLSLAASHVVSQTVALCLFTAVLGCFVLAAAHTINTVLPDDLTPSDKSLVLRYRESANRHVVLALCIATFYPAGYMLSRHYLHASEIEGFLLGNLPGLVAGAIFRKISPIAAGTQGETRRAQLLMLDRTRRAQAFSYAAFACCAIFAITMMAPDISRALHGQTVHLGEFNAFGSTALASLYMLAAPWTWFETPSVARIMEDESLARFRLLAYRNAFFVMALGLVLVADLIRNPPRLALLMVPVVFNAALFTAFATLVILELRAGTFKPSAETFDEPAENSAVGT